MEVNKITNIIIGCAIQVHKTLGPGLLESTYSNCLNYELIQAGLYVQKELSLPLVYKEIHMDIGYRIDMLVEKSVVIEVKSVEGLKDVHSSQVLTYLKLSGSKIGLLINFNEPTLMAGLKRFIM